MKQIHLIIDSKMYFSTYPSAFCPVNRFLDKLISGRSDIWFLLLGSFSIMSDQSTKPTNVCHIWRLRRDKFENSIRYPFVIIVITRKHTSRQRASVGDSMSIHKIDSCFHIRDSCQETLNLHEFSIRSRNDDEIWYCLAEFFVHRHLLSVFILCMSRWVFISSLFS